MWLEWTLEAASDTWEKKELFMGECRGALAKEIERARLRISAPL